MKDSLNKFSLNKRLIVLICFIIIFIAGILLNSLLLKVNFVVSVCFILLEAILAFLLKKTPIYIHGGVIILQIIAGAIKKMIPFVLISCVIYVAALYTVSVFLSENEKK